VDYDLFVRPDNQPMAFLMACVGPERQRVGPSPYQFDNEYIISSNSSTNDTSSAVEVSMYCSLASSCMLY
jgi:hypothetical protein